jgi:hypothetical protein
MGAGVAGQCSRKGVSPGGQSGSNRGRGGGAGRANSKKDLVTRPIRGFCALQASADGPGTTTSELVGAPC